jgi:FG-GAP-like repeat
MISMTPKRPNSTALFIGTALVSFLSQDSPWANAMTAFTLNRVDSADASYQETLLITDIDGDGDNDFFSGEGNGSKNWWFENLAGTFHKHLMSDSNAADVGAVLLDVNADGKIDKASSGFWFRNPGFAHRTHIVDTLLPIFHACRYSELGSSHDVVSADFNGDALPDLLTIHYDGIRWYRAPAPDSACGMWPVFAINGFTDDAQHGGLAAGDFDGDADIDVARLDRWFENADGKGETWIEHINLPFVTPKPGSWGLSGRALVFDMNGDGHADVVQTECDLPNGRVAWVENAGGRGENWKLHLIKDSTDGQDFHSLQLADFDGDGDIDVFSAGGNNSSGSPKAYLWENRDGKGGEWKEHILLDAGLPAHDAVVGDLDGDGDLDILFKGFKWSQHFMLENQLISTSVRKSQVFRFKQRNWGDVLRGRDIQGRRLKPSHSRVMSPSR